MTRDDSRIARASDYILGLMNDTERERAERDLEIDAAFRDTVMRMAERMRIFEQEGPADAGAANERWKLIAGRIAELPQMRSDSGSVAGRPMLGLATPRPIGMGLAALPNRTAFFVALGLLLAFALGYLFARLQ